MMAAQNPSISPGSPARHDLSARELQELVLVDGSTVDEVVEKIARARDGQKMLLGFYWKANQLPGLPERLDDGLVKSGEFQNQRFEYHFESETVYIDLFGGAQVELDVKAGLRGYIENQVAKLPATIDDPEIRHLVRSIKKNDTTVLEIAYKLRTQIDFSFGQAGALPFMICEVS